MTTLPKFSGDDARCSKCGYHFAPSYERVKTWYRPTGDYIAEGVWMVRSAASLVRTCPKCGYEWDEACLDAEQSQPTVGEITTLRNTMGPVGIDVAAEIRAVRGGQRMKRVYVAGPYSADNVMDVLANMRKGIEACSRLLRMDYAPFCPWLDFQFELVEAHPKDQYYAYSLAWLEVSDMLVLLPGWEKSPGTLREVEVARDRGIQMRLYCDTGLPFGEEVR